MEAPLGGSPAFVKLSVVVQKTMERAYGALVAVMDSSANKTDKERKQLLYEWFTRTRASVIRLLVVLKWTRTVPDINHTRDILSFLATQDAHFVSTADNLYTLHQRLQLVKAPIYDVPTAIDVLNSGSYTRLPTSIAAVAGPSASVAPKQLELKRRVEDMLHYRLFFSFTPPQYSDIKIENDQVILSVAGEFKASLMADGEALDKYPWRVADIVVYAGLEKDTPMQIPPPVLEYLKEILTQRLPVASQPLAELYNVLHSFCLSLQLELLFAQTIALTRGPWLDALWWQYVKDQSLSIFFWTPPPKAGPIPDDATYIQLRLDQERSLVINLFPPAPLADPIRLPRPLQAERLVLSAVAAHSLQRLTTLRTTLLADSELSSLLAPTDISITSHQDGTDSWHTLAISLGFNSHLIVAVDIKTGRFVAHLPPLPELPSQVSANELLNRPGGAAAASLVSLLMQQTLLDVFGNLISVHYSSDLVRVPGLLLEGFEVPPRALVHRYTDVEHSFVLIDVTKRMRVSCTAITTTPLDGGRRLKKVEEHSAELDLRDTSIPMIERCRRALTSALAAAQWARASRQVLTRFLETRNLRYTVAAPDRVVLPSLAEAEHFMPRLICFAALEGLWELRITEGDRLLRRPRIEASNGLRYHGGIWTFPLPRLSPPSLDELLRFVRSFGRLLRIAALFETALDAGGDGLSTQFKGPIVHSSAVQLQHISAEGDTIISISWRDEGYHLSFGETLHPLAAFFQAQLNSPVCDARAVLESIEQSLVPCKTLLRLIVQPTERTAQSPLPGDFTLVPHNSSQVRLVYRGTFGLDFTFLPGHVVGVEDAVKPAIRVVTTSLSPVSQLTTVLERIAIRSNSRFVVQWPSLPSVLHTLYRLLGTLFFMRRINFLLPEIDPPVAKADMQPIRCKLTLRSGQALVLHVQDNAIEVSPNVPAIATPDGLLPEEIEVLAVFNRNRVACEPFRLAHFVSFLHLLYLPADSLRQFVRLIAAIERKDLASLLLLHMALPPSAHLLGLQPGGLAIHYDKISGDVRFAVQLHGGTLHETDAFLRWSPAASRLSLWHIDQVVETGTHASLLEHLQSLQAMAPANLKAMLGK